MTREERRVYDKAWWAKNRERVLAEKAANPEKRRAAEQNRSAESKAAQKEYLKRYYLEHRDEIKSRTRQRELSDPERRRQEARKWQHANKEKREASTRAYREANPDKVSAARNAWYKANYKRWSAYRTIRRAALLQRTPAWADLDAIVRFYEECPQGEHVDHIEPLQGADVCGFHVLCNLQYLPALENLKKGNRRAT